MSNLKSKRIFSIDLCCVIGIILMTGFHFFSISGFEKMPISSAVSIFTLFLRWVCMTGLPLIIMLNGAVFFRKEFSFKSYSGLIKLLYFFIISFVIVNFYTSDSSGIIKTLKDFYTFQGSEFAVIYAGLLLTAPFLTLLYKNLPDKRSKQILIAVMCILTSLPQITIIFGIKLLPTAFTILYPVTLFFLGAYIYEYRKNFNAVNFAVMFFCLCLAESILSYSSSTGSETHTFSCNMLNNYGSPFNVAATSCLFIIMLKVRCHIPSVRVCMKYLANSILPIIMISWLIENKIIKIVISGSTVNENNILRYFPLYLIITVPLCFIFSSIIQAPFNIVCSIFNGKDNKNPEIYESVETPTAVSETQKTENEVPVTKSFPYTETEPVQQSDTSDLQEYVPQHEYHQNNDSRFYAEPENYSARQIYERTPAEETSMEYEPVKTPANESVKEPVKVSAPAPKPKKKTPITLDSILEEQTGVKKPDTDNVDELIKMISKSRKG